MLFRKEGTWLQQLLKKLVVPGLSLSVVQGLAVASGLDENLLRSRLSLDESRSLQRALVSDSLIATLFPPPC
jgi:hypothetical protein